MKEVGTLKELDVKPGDVVEWPGISEYVVQDDGVTVISTETGKKLKDGINYYGAKFRIVSRASDNPKLWIDMTPEEKGALLLAAHEGRELEYWRRGSGGWASCSSAGIYDNESYRVRPEPKVETVTINYWEVATDVLKNHRITFNTIDGKPDCASIKMEAL